MAWTPGVTTGATMASEFNALQTQVGTIDAALATLDADFDTLLAGFDTDVDARIALAALDDLADVIYASLADGHTLVWDAANTRWRNLAFPSTDLSYNASTRLLSSSTGADVTLPLASSTDAGLVPPSGGGTANFLRADMTWAPPPGGGGGSPGGASGEVQYNNAGAFAGAADVEIEGGQLRLPAISTPVAPAAGGVKLFGRDIAGRILPAIIGPSGLDTSLQPLLGRNAVAWAQATGNGTGISSIGLALASTGTATAKNWASTNRYTKMRGIEYLVTTASTTAIAESRESAGKWTVGSNAAGDGGFFFVCRWGPATGVATTTSRGFAGLNVVGAGTDVEPSSRANIVGMGWDAADTNIQFMHRGAGAVTKIDLGAGFPVPTVDRTDVYEIAMFSPPGTTQSVSYQITNLTTGAVATGTVTTNLPTTTTALMHRVAMSVGGTSSVIGICLFSLYIETDY